MRREIKAWYYLLPASLAAILLGLASGPAGFGLLTDPQVMAIRLPRVLLGMLAGAGLASSGAALQSALGNPLAEPYLLGVSGGAAFGAALTLLLGLSSGWGGAISLPLFSLVFGLLALYAVYRLGRVGFRLPSETVILSGIIVNAFFSALIMLLLALAGRQLQEMIYLLMGNLGMIFGTQSLYLLWVCAATIILCTAYLWSQGRNLDLLSLGEHPAQSLGLPVEKLKVRILLASALMVAAVVSLAGVIGFVGLVVPHLARMIIGPKNSRLVPLSVLLGANLLVLADALARTAAPQEIPVGVITSLLGVPFFTYLLRRKKRAGL
ncbi:iron ABC transporter permease [candidate division TA06 bacterium]|uniref:Iron ABC transporter permease n=1 Tax=candidate division TA06 bacterium TaxID=2250710 RepID=A0A933IDB2_UNCT6|nr:iron ABC transporter permease [candidate division TA06 bacterium]